MSSTGSPSASSIVTVQVPAPAVLQVQMQHLGVGEVVMALHPKYPVVDSLAWKMFIVIGAPQAVSGLTRDG
jgi:hypothetical protein